ncbi:hypothetical protein SGPA1_50089 [Streptomyces misionensis JCM 4497]
MVRRPAHRAGQQRGRAAGPAVAGDDGGGVADGGRHQPHQRLRLHPGRRRPDARRRHHHPHRLHRGGPSGPRPRPLRRGQGGGGDARPRGGPGVRLRGHPRQHGLARADRPPGPGTGLAGRCPPLARRRPRGPSGPSRGRGRRVRLPGLAPGFLDHRARPGGGRRGVGAAHVVSTWAAGDSGAYSLVILV